MSKLLEEYEQMLSVRDWYYYYSDDHSVWLRGERESAKCKTTYEELKKLGYLKELKALNDKYSPHAKG